MPGKPDGPMDWDAVFEDPEKGLITLINKAQTPEVLRQVTVVVIEKLFSRRNDGANREKFLKQMHGIVSEDAAAEDLDALKGSITTLLRSIRDDRKKKAEAFLSAKEDSDQAGRRTTDKVRFADLGKMAGAALAALKRPVVAVSVGVGIVVLGAVLAFILYADSGLIKSAQRQAAVEWVRAYAIKSPPIETAEMVSVKVAQGSLIQLTYMITDDRHAEILKNMSVELDIDLPPSVCPAKDSGIMTLIEQGFRLAITLESTAGRLSGGMCLY